MLGDRGPVLVASTIPPLSVQPCGTCFSNTQEQIVTRFLMLLGSRHTTRPAHAEVCGHHTTVSPLLFIAYPQTRVPAPSVPGPYAGAASAGPNPFLIALPTPASLNSRTYTQYLQIWAPECPSLTQMRTRLVDTRSCRGY